MIHFLIISTTNISNTINTYDISNVSYVLGHGECQHIPRDCFDVKEMGSNTSGVYQVTPVGVSEGFDVYCDMERDNGGWLVSVCLQLD